MNILVTGIAGFAGSNIAAELMSLHPSIKILGLDNFSRNGSEQNISQLIEMGVNLIRGDIRLQSDIDALPKVDWVIDCAANPSVLAGLNDQSSSRQLMEHNLLGTINLLEFCKKYRAFDRTVPIIVVPSSFDTIYEDDLARAGVKVVIYANQLLRSAYPSMVNTAKLILEHQRAYEARPNLMSIKECFENSSNIWSKKPIPVEIE